MKRLYILLLLLVAVAVTLKAQAPAGYYNNATNKTGEELRAALHNIIKNNDEHASYSGLWNLYQYTDIRTGTTDKIWDIYSDVPDGTPPYIFTFSTSQCGNYSNEGDCYNREHLWAQSWTNNDDTEKTDLHHVFPTDGKVNGVRSDYAFGEVSSPEWTSRNGSKKGPNTVSGFTGTVFEPIDAYKGDIARAMMYVSVRYYGEDSKWGNSDMTTKSVIKDWAIAMLLRWHEQDPVSQKEIDRNNAVYTRQGNRNPFIDNPDYAEMIWDPDWSSHSTDNYQVSVAANNNSCGIVYIGDEPSGVTPHTTSITFSQQSYDNEQNMDGTKISFLDSNVSVTFHKGSGANSPKYYTNGYAIRCYANNNYEVSTSMGSITSISFTYDSYGSPSSITPSTGSFTTDDKTTWEGNSSSVTFALGNSGQRRIKAISVTYETGSSSYVTSTTVAHGTVTSITAVPNDGYFFINWTKDNKHVSSAPTHQFTVTEAGNYVANFRSATIQNNETVTVPSAYLAENATLRIYSGAKLTVTGGITLSEGAKVIINNTGQLVNGSSGINAQVKKNISPWNTDAETGWYAISTPVDNGSFTNVTNLTPTNNSYNVYRLNETTMMWENSADTPFSSFENGRGYLYRRGGNGTITLQFNGTLNVDSVNYQLSYSTKGFHLVGNPYPHNIYKGENAAIPNDYLQDGFYTLSTDGGWYVGIDNNTAILPCQAIVVQAKSSVTDEYLTIKKIAEAGAKRDRDDNIMFAVSNNNYEDVAYAVFKEGRGLNKLDHRNDKIQKLYIQYGGEDLAIADIGKGTKLFNLNFHAATMGKYTMRVDKTGEFNYLHLIDVITGEDIDLLLENEYSFVGSSSDTDSRFIVKFRRDDAFFDFDEQVFAYQSGDEIVIDGEGELQVFDIMGRLVVTQYVSGVERFSAAYLLKTDGVYIFRLIGDEVKTQKIIVK